MRNQNCSPNHFELHQLSAGDCAQKILAELMTFRRLPKSGPVCRNLECPQCTSLYLPKISAAIKENKPITFVLPAFPSKSPNPEKVLGPLPDHAGRLSLHFLGTLCQRIKKYYLHGIKIILCSDGRVFSDVVGMKEGDVTAYQTELDRLIADMSLADIATFNLDHVYKQFNFEQMRHNLRQYDYRFILIRVEQKN